MITKNELEQFVQKMGLRHDIYYPRSVAYPRHTHINSDNLKFTERRTLMGFEFKPHVWYWWECLGHDFEHMMFSHRYDTNTGRRMSTWKKGFDAEYKITEMLKLWKTGEN
jgi:hypothetical protein